MLIPLYMVICVGMLGFCNSVHVEICAELVGLCRVEFD